MSGWDGTCGQAAGWMNAALDKRHTGLTPSRPASTAGPQRPSLRAVPAGMPPRPRCLPPWLQPRHAARRMPPGQKHRSTQTTPWTRHSSLPGCSHGAPHVVQATWPCPGVLHPQKVGYPRTRGEILVPRSAILPTCTSWHLARMAFPRTPPLFLPLPNPHSRTYTHAHIHACTQAHTSSHMHT